jgi:penicillin-binding protein 1C
MKKKLAISFSVLFLIGIISWLNCLPDKLFDNPRATVLLSKDGELLGARIAADGQWRFPESDSIPQKFESCLLTFEDRGFYNHWGVSIRGIVRALRDNIRAGKVESGASTLTMQLMRMARENQSRTLWQKSIEILWALRAELRYSKEEILIQYASQAPFGSNVVGLEAASWRYFNKPPHLLTWSESATLAVLPNAPGLIYPGRNSDQLIAKRNRLLQSLLDLGKISESDYRLALLEKVPQSPLSLPNTCHHLTDLCNTDNPGKIYKTTIDRDYQVMANKVLAAHLKYLERNRIFNGAILIADNSTGEIVAYVGNGSGNKESQNNMITAERSSGSILKPFLYARAMEEAELAPQEILADIPTQFAGFAPKNFDENYDGAVPADEALTRSLNIPAVRLLNDYGVPRFLNDLRSLGFENINQSADHYGLSLILGGAEVRLWDLVQTYSTLAQELNGARDFLPGKIHFINSDSGIVNPSGLSQGTLWILLNTLCEVKRPTRESAWKVFKGEKIAWKTGTSYGYRDAWAVGISRKYTVGIWIGNASGEGRPGITGLNVAAPLLFDVFNSLPRSNWFEKPEYDLIHAKTCKHSGMRASDYCADTELAEIPLISQKAELCHYCKPFFINGDGFRVYANCSETDLMQEENRFILPPVQEWYYKKKHANYLGIPELAESCRSGSEESPINLIYPYPESSAFIPRELSGEKEKIVLKAVHRDEKEKIFWHLDAEYLGETRNFHHMEIQNLPGIYRLTLTDEKGSSFTTQLHIN